MKLKIAFLVAYVCSISAVLAGGGNDVSKFRANWGGGTMTYCASDSAPNMQDVCIGEDKCETNWGTVQASGDSRHDRARLMMVATKVAEHGAQLCPVQVEARRGSGCTKSEWTTYAKAGSNCVWLCRDGWTGPECKTTYANVNSADATELQRSNYNNVKRVASGANIEDEIAMFNFDDYHKCTGSHKRNMKREAEHDMILAISGWLPSGHGAYVQQMVVHARWFDGAHCNQFSAPYITPAENAFPVLVCKDGYRPNAQKDDCVEINSVYAQTNKTCAGFTTGFDATKHQMKYNASGQCLMFTCLTDGQAFASSTDKTCVDCVNDLRNGVSERDGTCVRCSVGQIFDGATSTCVAAQGYTKTDMQYGAGNSRNSVGKLDSQCWTKTTTAEYVECVKQKK